MSSEFPFVQPDATASICAYDGRSGALVGVFAPPPAVPFRRPRGLRFGPDGHLYCVARDAVVAFDYDSGYCFGAVVHHPRLSGQAVEFFGMTQV